MRDLPDFERPPLVEVALGVQFDPLTLLRTAHVGLLWARFRSEFPRVEDQPPLAAVVERFGVKPLPSRPRLTLSQEARVNRSWFLNESGSQLVQVQPDRFIHNWRKLGARETYPRYEAIADAFVNELVSLEEFLATEGLGELRFNQCEVIYVNVIEPTAGSDHESWHRNPQAMLTVLNLPAGATLGAPEDAAAQLRYVIPGSGGRPAGRLTVELQPAYTVDNTRECYQLQLTARGEPIGEGIAGARRFLDLGRRVIVRSFSELTTAAMHTEWGRIQ